MEYDALPEGLPLSGYSALSELTMLGGTPTETFTFFGKAGELIGTDTLIDSNAHAEVEIWRYDPVMLSKRPGIIDIFKLSLFRHLVFLDVCAIFLLFIAGYGILIKTAMGCSAYANCRASFSSSRGTSEQSPLHSISGRSIKLRPDISFRSLAPPIPKQRSSASGLDGGCGKVRCAELHVGSGSDQLTYINNKTVHFVYSFAYLSIVVGNMQIYACIVSHLGICWTSRRDGGLR